VARAVSDYFAHSGEFSYQLEMRRVDGKMDPIEDFLRNTRTGFCEHYAAGLALVLRSVGIPTRVVVGFRGAEAQGETPGMEGVYLVRQSDAHSWVEALVTRPGPDGVPEPYWLALDPTPAGDARAATSFSWLKWWRSNQQKLRDFWKNLVLDYNIDRQQDGLAAIGRYVGLDKAWNSSEAVMTWIGDEVLTGRLFGRRWPWLAIPPLFGFGMWGLRRRKRSRPGLVVLPSGEAAFYGRWLALIAGYLRVERQPSQTPREFGETVRQALNLLPGAAAAQDVSRRVVDLYYRVLFGGRTLTSGERAAIERDVADLEPALRVHCRGEGRP
jgi:hypothetical protein